MIEITPSAILGKESSYYLYEIQKCPAIKAFEGTIGDIDDILSIAHDCGAEHPLIVTRAGLTLMGEDQFVRGFESCVPDIIPADCDALSEGMWSRPWFWAKWDAWFCASKTPYEMGVNWAKNNAATITALVRAMKGVRDEAGND